MNFLKGWRAADKSGWWPLLATVLFSWLKTICILLLTAILRVNI